MTVGTSRMIGQPLFSIHLFPQPFEGPHPTLIYALKLFVWFLNVLVNYHVISRTGPKTERQTILRAAAHETELRDHDFCLSRSHYTDTDPTSRDGRSQRESNPGPPHQESRALPTELPPPPPPPPPSFMQPAVNLL